MNEINPGQLPSVLPTTGAVAARRQGILGFVIGAVAASILWGGSIVPRATRLSQSEQGTLQSMRQRMGELQNENQNLTTEVNTCQAKFSRGTFIYDIGLLNTETRAWYIPADIDPVALGQKRGSYSHFDPRTQTETVHLPPKTQ
jgi:hypothetical protein